MLLWSCLASSRVVGREHLILPAFAIPITPVAVVTLAVVVAVVPVGAVVVVLTVVMVSLRVACSLVAVAVMVMVVAAFLRAGVHGGHVIHSHLGAVTEALVSHRASRPEVWLVKSLCAGKTRVTVLLQVAAALAQVFPRPFVILV